MWHRQLCVVSQLCELNRAAKKDQGTGVTVERYLGGGHQDSLGWGGSGEEAGSEIRELQKVREESASA